MYYTMCIVISLVVALSLIEVFHYVCKVVSNIIQIVHKCMKI